MDKLIDMTIFNPAIYGSELFSGPYFVYLPFILILLSIFFFRRLS